MNKKMLSDAVVIPTILSGGVGSRLWPVSREAHPKPFIRLEDGHNLLQKSFLRGAALPNTTEILTVTNRDLFFQSKDSYHELNRTDIATSFLLEPFGRNTAPAIAAAALHIAKKYGRDAVLLVLPADHLIANQAAFNVAVAEAVELSKQGKLVTFGVKPTAPESGYGYIEADGNDVIRFVEKPTRAVAETYLASGNFFWNSGMFCFSAGTILDEMSKHCPEILSAVQACFEKSTALAAGSISQIDMEPGLFQHIKSDSIDYAVMEKSDQVAIVSCDVGWSDVGSWLELGGLAELDDSNNRVQGDVVLEDVKGCIIQSKDHLIGCVGVEDLIIVNTADALLVAKKDRAQDVKRIFQKLKDQGHEAHKSHVTTYRPWGSYTILEEDTGFKIKRIEVKPGAKLSLQMHHHRSEHWVMVEGVAKVTNGDKEIVLNVNESVYIPAKNKHRLENLGTEMLVMIEVQCGPYLGEDDIVRFDDVYGRVEAK